MLGKFLNSSEPYYGDYYLLYSFNFNYFKTVGDFGDLPLLKHYFGESGSETKLKFFKLFYYFFY